MHLVLFLRYSASKNGVTLKLGVGVVQGNWKWRRLITNRCRHAQFAKMSFWLLLIVFIHNYC